MAIYRQIHTTYWKDKRIGKWTLSQKAFYLYLLTNDFTTQCGVYEFNELYAQVELGMGVEEIREHIKFLVSEGRIVYNEKSEELMILNWLKYNSARSPKVAKVIDKELKEIKTFEFEQMVIMKCSEYGYPIETKEPKKDTVSIPYPYSTDTITQPEPEPEPEPTQNNTAAEAEAHEEKPESPPAAAAKHENAFVAFQRIFGHSYSPFQAEDMGKWIEDVSEPVLIEAMSRSGVKGRDYAYATGILKSWAKKGVKSLADIEEDDQRFERQTAAKISKFNKQPVREEKLPEWAKDDYEPPAPDYSDVPF